MSTEAETCPPFKAECPHCGIKNVAMEVLGYGKLELDYQLHKIDALVKCGSCERCVLVAFSSEINHLPTIIYKINTKDDTVQSSFTIFPLLERQGAPPDTDEDVALYYNQGEDNLPHNPDAAVAMFRAALEIAIRKTLFKKDQEAELNLHDAIGKAHREGKITDSMKDWADSIKDFGNKGAHGEKVSSEGAIEIKEFSNVLLQYLYTLPVAVTKHRARKENRRTRRRFPKAKV